MNHPTFLLAVVIAGRLYVFGQYVSSDPVRNADRHLTVQAVGTSKSAPNIGHVTLGVQVQARPTAQEATDTLGSQSNAVIAAVKALGIADGDIKTQNVSVQPAYNYNEGKQTLRGYEASQQIEITVRKTDQSGEVIARATEAGANQVGGVTFENEDNAAQTLAAEKDAIDKAKKKAEEIASGLGARLGKVKNYSASQSYPGPMAYAQEMKVGMGGDVANVPQIPVGTNEVTASVTITYELR